MGIGTQRRATGPDGGVKSVPSDRLMDYWRALELFSPQPWPKAESSRFGSTRLRLGQSPPWRIGRYAVFAGAVQLEKGGSGYVCACILLDDGTLVEGSPYVPAQALIGMNRSVTIPNIDAYSTTGVERLGELTQDLISQGVWAGLPVDASSIRFLDLGSVQPQDAFGLEDLVAIWRDRQEDMITVGVADQVPWPRTAVTRYTVHAGLDQGVTYDVIAAATGPASSEIQQVAMDEKRPSGKASLLTFMIADDGRAIAGSLRVSQHGLALSRTISPGPSCDEWLDVGALASVVDHLGEYFDLEVAGVRSQELHDYRAAIGENLGLPGIKRVTAESMAVFLAYASKVLGLGVERLVADELRCACYEVKKELGTLDEVDLLDSFYLDPLASGRALLRTDEADAIGALRAYVTEISETERSRRVLSSDDPKQALLASAPGLVPLGRWPSQANESLSLGQQIAVNTILNQVGIGQPVAGVNGPPGTGKTTLLKDVIAAVVVNRAQEIAKLDKPWLALPDLVEDMNRSWSCVADGLTGFEIVVASSNNAAVENISAQIPSVSAVGKQWHREVGIGDKEPATFGFADVASRLTGGDPNDPAWALIAAVLGKSKNRRDFADALWSTKPGEHSMHQVLEAAKGATRDERVETWKLAVQDFETAVRQEQAIRTQREQAFASLTDLPVAQIRLDHAEEALHSLELRLAEATTVAQDCEDASARAQSELATVNLAVAAHQDQTPSALAKLFSQPHARQWRELAQNLTDRLAETLQASSEMQLNVARAREAERLSRSAVSKAASNAEMARLAADRLRDEVEASSAKLGDHFPDQSWWATDRIRREKSSPWCDPEWNVARTAIFLAAIELHRRLILCAPHHFYKNLQMAVGVVKGVTPASGEQLEAAWQTLFLAVPVVSTTFASAHRMLAGLNPGTLGWLLIDEAGQAEPQAAVGAIAKTRRTIAVGDPLQLAPVDTIPPATRARLGEFFAVPKRWVESQVSVQHAVDAHTPWGTAPGTASGTAHDMEDNDWVGLPLSVHRRCADPMFAISNQVAYDGRMVFATLHKDREFTVGVRRGKPWWESCWIDVQSQETSGNCQPAEVDALRQLLEELLGGGVEPKRIRVLAPFRNVADQVRSVAAKLGVARSNAGTVHTAQGREAEIVVFVLGSASGSAGSGSREWVNSTPNLVNVAVSRAQRRLYVIGDRSEWSALQVTATMADALPVCTLNALLDCDTGASVRQA